MNKLGSTLKQAGFSELACQFSAFIGRRDQTNDLLIAYTAALVSEASSQGHVCLVLSDVMPIEGLESIWPKTVVEWHSRLIKSQLVTQEGGVAPLVLTEQGAVYLYRYWQDEHTVAEAIKQRLKPAVFDDKKLTEIIRVEQADNNDLDWQKVALLMAMTRQLCVISGGPGTGKTTIVLQILARLFQQNSAIKIKLAAPTGKAATRLQQVIGHQFPDDLEVKTLHRLLAIHPQTQQARYNQQRPLIVDVLIIDEASMINISLMAKIMVALPANARVILLGDSDQLASVESGAVLANLCHHSAQFSNEFRGLVQQQLSYSLPPDKQGPKALEDSVVFLQKSHRFEQGSDIGLFSQAIKAGDVAALFSLLEATSEHHWQKACQLPDIEHYALQGYQGYQGYFDLITQGGASPEACLKSFEAFQLLCTINNGAQSVDAINRAIERKLQQYGWPTDNTFYHGKPIMITKNNYQHDLYNGDIGLILQDEDGALKACFHHGETLRWLHLAQLPTYETAFAMTIHKSQGSEFDKVCIILPEEEVAVLNKALLYTAITRAKKQVILLASEAILRKTVTTDDQRQTGLARLLTI